MDGIFGMSKELTMIMGIFLFLMIVLFIMNISNQSKIKKLKKKFSKLMSAGSGQNIEEILESCIDKVNQVGVENKEIKNQINSIERNIMNCIQKVGVIRFNAFDNVGSDLSFSIALLDDNDNGVVISGLYSRDSSATYAKPVLSGKSKHALSAEEMKAIDTAKKYYRDKIYFDK